MIVEDPRREMLSPLRFGNGVPDGHVDEESMTHDPLDRDVHLADRRKRPWLDCAKKRGIEPLEEKLAARRDMAAARRELRRAHRVVRDIDQIAREEHHVENPTELETFDVAPDPGRCTGHVPQHVRGIVDRGHRVAVVEQAARQAAGAAAELENRTRRWKMLRKQVELAAVRKPEIDVDGTPVLGDDAGTFASRGLHLLVSGEIAIQLRNNTSDVAEGVRFELTRRLARLPVFKTGAFDRSANLPQVLG